MKLLIAAPLYPPQPGGPATYAKLLTEGLPSHGITVETIIFSDVHRYPKFIRTLVYGYRIYKGAKDADLILALDPVSVGFPAYIAALFTGKPYVVKVVGDYAWEQGTQRFGVSSSLLEFQRERSRSLPVLILRAVQQQVARSARAVVVPSEFLKKVILGWGVSASNITVIYNALQNERPGAVPSAVVKLQAPLIVSAGRLVPWKGFPAVIDAVANLQKEGITASLAIVGDGPERERIEAYAKRVPNTLVVGALSHQETLAVIDRADVFVLNSSYEGLSHILIEALSLGVPVVATNVGGNPELITHNENGLLVPLENTEELTRAIRHLLDKREAERLTKDSTRFASRFSANQMLVATAKFLSSL